MGCGCGKKNGQQSAQQQANRQAARLKARLDRQQAALKFKQEQAQRYAALQQQKASG